MTSKQRYNYVHQIAKLIVCAINTILLLLSKEFDVTIILIFLNFTYFFGVNSIAYLIEAALHYKHKHNKI